MLMNDAKLPLPAGLETLSSQVQHNCHISDARSASDYTLCVYLLKMREYYRWEQGLPYGAALSSAAIGDWLTAREELWESLLERDFQPLEIDGRHYDPVDAAAENNLTEMTGSVVQPEYGCK